MDTAVKTTKEELIDNIEDLIIPEDVLYANNTFSVNALNTALERLSLINFWSLYQTQRARIHMERFDIPFSEFLPTFRLSGEKDRDYFPKRNVAYIDYQFIPSDLRKKYRDSEFYNRALNQEEIASDPAMFRFNHLVFINGEYISTTEIYPQESKTGVIIDCIYHQNDHGMSVVDIDRYTKENATVTVLMVPSFKVATIDTNQATINKYNGKIPFSKISGSEYFTKDTICFVNSEAGMCRKFWSDKITCDTTNQVVKFNGNIGAGGNIIRLCFITFDYLFAKRNIEKSDPYTRITEAKMPCPKEHFIIFSKASDGKILFNHDAQIDMYYPNIFKFSNIGNSTNISLVLQDENIVTESETFENELAKFEEYVELLPLYQTDKVSELLKNYKPSSFVYSIKDYEGSIYVPSTMNYKIQKLHKTIHENPWALSIYLNALNLPTDKFYLDMAKIDLSKRIRRNSSQEDTDSGVKTIEFNEDMYVFAMNRHFVDTRSYGFRIFIDGFFQTDNTYKILPGPNFYFIYIPVSKIKSDSMIEIERYKLYSIERVGTVEEVGKPIIELDFSGRQMFGYTREIYAFDASTRFYIPKKYLKIEILYIVDGIEKWVEVPIGRNIPLTSKVRISVTNEAYIGKTLRIGLQRKVAMSTGNPYHDDADGRAMIYWYTKGEITNIGGYDKGNYRIFNNGRLLLPNQYYINLAKQYGGKDFFRTSCELSEGDTFTIDHTPTQFRVVYYQAEIDSSGKLGYVDLDGKIALPINLKWYDIYLNGRKLHKNNIEIVSPTKFYVQGVESRFNLLIVARNRDEDIFHLPYSTTKHNSLDDSDPDKPSSGDGTNPPIIDDEDDIDWNNTIIDDLMNDILDLKGIIDKTKQKIDPNNESRNTASNIAANIDALIFFYEYLTYTFINANKRQITQEIKDEFPSLLEPNGVMSIDGNDGTENKLAKAFLIKDIKCNIAKGEDEMYTDPSVDFTGTGMLQDRYAVRPLNTDNYESGLREEMLIDPNTAEPALVNDDGTVTSISTMTRKNDYIENFSSKITTFGMGRADIYQIKFDDEYKTKVYTNGENLLTEDIEIPEPISLLCVGIDTTFLTQNGDCKMLDLADVDPTVTIGYKVDGVAHGLSCKLSRLKDNIIEVDNKLITLTLITLTGIPSLVSKTFIHSILLAF